MVLACITGAVPSILCVVFLNNALILNITKFITAILMLIIAFKHTKKQFIFNFILLFLYTYTFGGIITSLNSQTYYTSFGAVMTSKFSLELICLILIVSTYIFEGVAKYLKFKINTNNLIYKCKLTFKNKTIKINAYLDTGNFLNLNGQPIFILDLDTYLKLTNTDLISFLTAKSSTIETTTVNGKRNLKIFNIDKLEIQNETTNLNFVKPIIAVNTNNCFKNTNFQAILSPLFL